MFSSCSYLLIATMELKLNRLWIFLKSVLKSHPLLELCGKRQIVAMSTPCGVHAVSGQTKRTITKGKVYFSY